MGFRLFIVALADGRSQYSLMSITGSDIGYQTDHSVKC